MNKQTILITGASGFIGQHLLTALTTSNEYNILSPTKNELNILDSKSVSSYFSQHNIDIIIHLAAISSPSKSCDIMDMVDTNINGTTRLLGYMKPECKFIFASSITAGGTCYDFKTELDKDYPISLYATTKLSCEHLVATHAKNYIILRLCAVIGGIGLTHGCVLDFNNKIKDDSSDFTILGSYPGSNKPYLHISSVLKAFIKAIKYDKNDTFNITNNDSITIEEISGFSISTS